jgi:hypothetical protein
VIGDIKKSGEQCLDEDRGSLLHELSIVQHRAQRTIPRGQLEGEMCTVARKALVLRQSSHMSGGGKTSKIYEPHD